MGKAAIKEAGPFTPEMLLAASENLKATDSPVTRFKFGGTEFSVTLLRIGGSRVPTKAERQLMKRIAAGQDTLTAKENRLARRILKQLP